MRWLLPREKIRYLEEGGEETADIPAKYPREPPEIAPPQFTKEQVPRGKVTPRLITKKGVVAHLYGRGEITVGHESLVGW